MNITDLKLNTWYKDENIMMYPYRINQEQEMQKYTYTFNGDTYSMLTVQVITFFGPKRWEVEDSDEWQIRSDYVRQENMPRIKRDYLYWDEKEWCIEEKDIEIPNENDFRRLIYSIFTYNRM